MDIGSILLLLALVVVVGVFIASPLRTQRERKAVGKLDIELSQLLAERERILEALAELDFDNDMGKIPDDLYPLQREALLKRGAAVLRLLDEYRAVPADAAATEPERAERLERAASIRPVDDDPLEAMIATRRKQRTPAVSEPADKPGQPGKFCPNCGDAIKPGDRFCASCGHQLV